MIIRYLTPNDVPQHDRVASQAFVFSCEIGDPASVLPCEKVLGAFADDNETLLADLEVHERKCHYDGGLLRCAAIGGVAAKPEHRGKGAVKALFDRLFREELYDISILYPFSEAYYRKLGYERAGFALSASIPFSGLTRFGRNSDVTLYEGKDTARLLDIYNRCARRYNLSFVRETTECFSDKPYLSQTYTYIRKNNAAATISVDREKSTVFVKELWYDSCESMCGILGFLRNFEANQKTVCFQNLPANTPLLHFVQDLKGCEITLHPTGAARVFNVENVLRAHQYPPQPGTFTIRIGSDVYRVSYADKNVEVIKDSRLLPEVILEIGAASQILLCGIADAAYAPGLEIRDPDTAFFRAFPPKTTFFTDNF